MVPEYHPRMSQTDFLDDKHLFYIHMYVKFLSSLEMTIGADIRNRIESAPYETYLQKLTKNVRFDSYTYGRNMDPEF